MPKQAEIQDFELLPGCSWKPWRCWCVALGHSQRGLQLEVHRKAVAFSIEATGSLERRRRTWVVGGLVLRAIV